MTEESSSINQTNIETDTDTTTVRSGRDIYNGFKYFKRSTVDHNKVYMLDLRNKFDCYVPLINILNTIEFLLTKKAWTTFYDRLLSFNEVIIDFDHRNLIKKKGGKITDEHFYKKEFSLRHIERKVNNENPNSLIFAKEEYVRKAFGLNSYLQQEDDDDDDY